jgi:predicted O-methyltransferase YrrM
MDFHAVADLVESAAFIDRWHARQLYDHIRETGARDVLELGTAHGGSTAYLAAAVAANGGGKVTSVDRYHFQEPSPEETLERAGLSEAVGLVRVEHSSYTWWLKEQVKVRSDAAGNCDPIYDLCFLDGAHDWHIDGLAVVLIERLLRPEGWLVLDDLNWSYETGHAPRPANLSPEEITTPHLQEIFDVILRPHPAFGEFRTDDLWGWARKTSDTPRRLTVLETRVRRTILTQRVNLAARRVRNALRKRLPGR